STSTWDKYDQVTLHSPSTALAKRMPTNSFEISSSSLNQRPHQSMAFLTGAGPVRPSGPKSAATDFRGCATVPTSVEYMATLLPIMWRMSQSLAGFEPSVCKSPHRPPSGDPASLSINLSHDLMMTTVPGVTGVQTDKPEIGAPRHP